LTKSSNDLSIKIMEDLIFKIFILNPSWMIKSFSIFPSLCFIGVNYLIILKLLEYNKIELLFAILVGIIGSYFIFKDDEVNNKK